MTPHDGAKTSAETGVRLLHMGYAQAPGDPAHKAHRNIPLLQREIERFPDDEYYHFQLGKAYFSIEAWAEATEALEAALARIDFSQPSPRGRLAPVARNVLTDAVCTLAYARGNLGAFDEAVALVKRHQEMAHAGTKWADFEHAQGYAYLMRGDFAASRRAFEAALALGPSREDVLGAGSFSAAYHMGLLCEAEDDLIGALNWYLRAVHYNPGHAPALRRCVDLVAERGIVLPPEIYAACQSSVLDGFYTAKLDACLAKGEDGAVATLLQVAASLSPALAEACARQCAMHE